MPSHPFGVLLMSYGTPERMEDLLAYYTHIRRGRPPSTEELNRLQSRYEVIGGLSPLRAHTDRQAEALAERLAQSGEPRYRLYQGYRHAKPFIEDAILQMKEDGIMEAVGLILAPHFSAMSIGGYIRRAREEAVRAGIGISFIERYGLHPLFVEMWADFVQEAYGREADRGEKRLLFTAHSLPARILEERDPYPDELMESARAIAQRAKIKDWDFAWQSAGFTREPWLGPDLLEMLPRLKDEGVKEAVIAPIGFVSEHLEILYDIDHEAAHAAGRLGMKLTRTRMPETEPRFIEVLSGEIHRKAMGIRA